MQGFLKSVIYRGYYMTAWRYEISLRVLKNISRVSTLYKHQWNTKPFHFNSFLVWKARFIIFVAKAKVMFSHLKITCYFHMWRYQVFAWKLTWYLIGVYITHPVDVCNILVSAISLLPGFENGLERHYIFSSSLNWLRVTLSAVQLILSSRGSCRPTEGSLRPCANFFSLDLT